MTTDFFNKANNITIEAIGTVHGGEYGKIVIEGVGKITDSIQFEKLEIEGTCKSHGDHDGNLMSVQGIYKGDGNIKVRRLEVEGVMKTADKKIYADEIIVEGILSNGGEVNADKIRVEGCINFNDLFGDDIVINYSAHSYSVFSFGKSIQTKINKANNIECTTLKACNITCHSISATDIYLESHCVVDTINCNGTLHYDSTCTIRNIEGECEKIIS